MVRSTAERGGKGDGVFAGLSEFGDQVEGVGRGMGG